MNLYTSNKAVDFATVLDEMKRQGVYDRFGGQAYIAELMSCITTTANAGYHIDIVRDYAFRRRLLEASDKIANLAYKYDTESREIMDEAERIIFEASSSKDSFRPSGK